MIRMKISNSGFTLVELMVVVAILGLLAGLAVPQFADLVQKSKEAMTRGNLATIWSALSIYYADNEETYPFDDLSSLIISRKYLTNMPLASMPPYHEDLSRVLTT